MAVRLTDHSDVRAGFLRRLRLRMDTLGFTQADLCRRLETVGVQLNRQSISGWFHGSFPDGIPVIALPLALRCRPEWLYYGEGAVEPSASGGPDATAAASAIGAQAVLARVQALVDDLKREWASAPPADGDERARAARVAQEAHRASGGSSTRPARRA